MSQPKVSILVAVYNAEKYLHQCLDSIINQSLADIEAICIDDCSTDSSRSILEEYSKKDSRIKTIFLNENVGQAAARNKGLDIAEGEYIAMLDSDDWFAEDALQLAVDTIEGNDADCAMFDLILCREGQEEPFKNQTDKSILTGEEAFRLSLNWQIHGLYIVKADIHKNYPFDTSCRLYSDDNTTRLHYLHSRKVALSKGKYFYRKHAESMTESCNIHRFDYVKANLSMKQQLLEEIRLGNINHSEDILNLYETHRWLNFVDTYYYLNKNRDSFSKEEAKQIEASLADILQTFEPKRIDTKTSHKFGYCPTLNYNTFKIQEEAYFLLRGMIGKNK